MPTPALYIPPGPDADGGRRALAAEARALGLDVEWPGEPNARERRAELRAARRAPVLEVPMVKLKASAFRDGAATIGVGAVGAAA